MSELHTERRKVSIFKVEFKGSDRKVTRELKAKGYSPTILERCGPIGHLYFFVKKGREKGLKGFKSGDIYRVERSRLGSRSCSIEKIY